MDDNELTFSDITLMDSELYSEVSNLDLALQCWKPSNLDNQDSCKSMGLFAKYVHHCPLGF